jgi:hypothetical protein
LYILSDSERSKRAEEDTATTSLFSIGKAITISILDKGIKKSNMQTILNGALVGLYG